jgi:hypothetical protein
MINRWIRVSWFALIGSLVATAAMAAPIYWDQTQSFSLTATPERVIRYEDGSGRTIGHFSQEATMSFQGAPQTFVLAGTRYSLTGITTTVTSSFYNQYLIQAYDSNMFSDMGVEGYVSTGAGVLLPALLPYNGIGGGQYVWQDSLFYEYVYLPGKDPAQKTGSSTVPINFTYDWLAGENGSSNLAFFLNHTTFDFLLEKGAYLHLVSFISDDNYDAVSNPVSNWIGTLNMRYTYEAVPTPLPSALLLLTSGLGAVAALTARRRRSKSGE